MMSLARTKLLCECPAAPAAPLLMLASAPPAHARLRRALAKMHADEKDGSDPIIRARAGTSGVSFVES